MFKEESQSKKNSEEIIQAVKLMNSGKYNEALLILSNLEEKGGLDASDQLSCHLTQSSILNKLGNYQESYNIGEQAYQESQNLKKYLQSIDALIYMSRALVWMGDLETATNLAVESEDLLKSLNQESTNNLENKKASIAYVNALISWFRGEMKQSLEYGKLSLRLREKYKNKHEIAESLSAIGFAYSFSKSDLNEGLKYAEGSLILAEEINYQQILNYSHLNIGVIYNLKGEYEQALKHYKQCLPFFEETNNKQWLSATLANISIVYRHRGKYDLSVKYLERCLKLSRETGNNWFIATNLCNLIDILRLKGNIDQAKDYLEELEKLNNSENNNWIEMAYLVSKAVILKESHRIHNRAKAEKILKQVIQREIIPNLDINIDAIVNLCELLLDELRITNDIGVLDDLNPYIRQLLELAEKNNSFWILAETYVLQAKLALLTLDLKRARYLLTLAQQIAEKQGIHRLAAKISIEHDDLLQKLNIWKRLKNTEPSLSARIKLTNMEEQIRNMIKKRRNKVPEILKENPVMILVISEGGGPAFSKLFEETLVIEDDLISSFLAAFNQFSGELFSEGLDRATFGQYTLLMKPISTFLVCYLFEGQSYSAQKKIQDFVENIENNEKLLAKFNNFYHTNQIIKLEEVPLLKSLVSEIFIERKIK